MKTYLKVLAIFYFIGAALHFLDLFDLRLEFSSMSMIWKLWIVYLTLADSLATYGLWNGKRWGEMLFVFIAVSQLIAYVGFPGIFFNQSSLIAFHVICLSVYGVLKYKQTRSLQ